MPAQIVYRLNPILNWPQPSGLPQTTVICRRTDEALSFIFDVCESKDCFRNEHRADGQACWQDSCCEVFIASPKKGGYFNFETNAQGRTLAQFGKKREGRADFSAAQYAAVRRLVLAAPLFLPDGRIRWSVQIDIPTELLSISASEPVVGNLYKCASYAESPHYLSAFPVRSPMPDFHRCESFKNIFK